MDEKNKDIKYLVIHTHFYQPIREDPYSGEIEIDFTAKPYDNWNHRIALECYFPNLYSRIYNDKNEIIEMINNCKYYNLNFGPTLLSWIEKKYPYYYEKILRTFRENANLRKNFIAQAYNHTILPLDSFIDKLIQIIWGIKDFENRFGEKPQGMWLGECAVNQDVLKILIDNGIKYIILSPHQIKQAIDPNTNKTKPIIPNMIYRWYDKTQDNKTINSRFIDIIAYDDIISKKIAFNNITFNSEIFSKELLNRYSEIKTNIIVVALDGETFGHHLKFSDLTLAHAFRYEFSKNKIEVISAYQYLSNSQIYAICEINEGPDNLGTSWSCEHGIRRWTGGCPCGDEGRYSTEWRKGLRIAIDWLSDIINDIFNEEGKKIFKNHFDALKEYIEVINQKISLKDFLSKHLIEHNQETFLRGFKLLEMFRYKMLSRTSCGWFFNDISRIETQNIMRYAMITSEIAQELGYLGIEKGFESLLETAKSNFQDLKNGKFIYEKYIKPKKANEETILTYLIIKSAYQGIKYYKNNFYNLELYETNINNELIEIKSKISKFSGEEYNIFLKIDFSSLKNINIYIIKNQNYEFKIDIHKITNSIQVEILNFLLNIRKSYNINKLESILESTIEIAEFYQNINLENLYEEITYFTKNICENYIVNFIRNSDIKYIDKINYFLQKLENLKLKINFPLSTDILMMMPAFLDKLKTNSFNLDEIEKIKETFSKLNMTPFVFHIENYLYEIKENNVLKI